MSVANKYVDYVLSHRVLLHVLYWMCVFVYFCLYGLGINQPFLVSFYLILVDFPVQIIATYVFIYFQLPLLYDKKYFSFFISVISLGYLFYIVVHFNYDYGIGTRLISWHKPHSVIDILISGEFLFINSVEIYVVVFITAIIKFVKDRLSFNTRLEQLEAEVARVEYHSVLGMIEPRLMLDSLDKIIYESEQKSKEAPKIIADMSEVLDGVLYKTRVKEHAIIDEIAQLESYLSLVAQVYPKVRKKSYEKELISGIDHIPVLCLQKVMSFLYHSLNTRTKDADLDILLIETKSELLYQISVGHEGDDRIDLNGLDDIIVAHYKERALYIIIEEREETIVKITVSL